MAHRFAAGVARRLVVDVARRGEEVFTAVRLPVEDRARASVDHRAAAAVAHRFAVGVARRAAIGGSDLVGVKSGKDVPKAGQNGKTDRRGVEQGNEESSFNEAMIKKEAGKSGRSVDAKCGGVEAGRRDVGRRGADRDPEVAVEKSGSNEGMIKEEAEKAGRSVDAKCGGVEAVLEDRGDLIAAHARVKAVRRGRLRSPAKANALRASPLFLTEH